MNETSEKDALADNDSCLAKTKATCGKRRGGFRPRKRKKSFARLGSIQRKANQRERRRAQRIREGFRGLAEALASSGAASAGTINQINASYFSEQHGIADESTDAACSSGKLPSVNFSTEWTQISTLTTACAYIGHLGRLLDLNGGAKKIHSELSTGAQQMGPKAKRSLSDETDLSGESDNESGEDGCEQSSVFRVDACAAERSPTAVAKCPWTLRPPAKRRSTDKPGQQSRAKTERFTFIPGESEPTPRPHCNRCLLCTLWSGKEVTSLNCNETTTEANDKVIGGKLKEGSDGHGVSIDKDPETAESGDVSDIEEVVVDESVVSPCSTDIPASPSVLPELDIGTRRLMEDGGLDKPMERKLSTDTEAVSALLKLGKEAVCFDAPRSPDSPSPTTTSFEDSPLTVNTELVAKSPPPPKAPANQALGHHHRLSGYTMATAERKKMRPWMQPQGVAPPTVIFPPSCTPWPSQRPASIPVVFVPQTQMHHGPYSSSVLQPAGLLPVANKTFPACPNGTS